MSDRGFEYFSNEVKRIEQAIETIRSDMQQLEMLHSDSLQSAVAEPDAVIRRDNLTSAITVQCKQLRADFPIREGQLVKSDQIGQGEKRVILTKLGTEKKRFLRVLEEFENSQSAYKDRVRKRVKKQLDIAGVNVDEDQFEEIVQSGGQSAFSSVLSDTRVAKATLNDMQMRANEVGKLEREIGELHELYINLAVMVEEQDAAVDSIAFNVERAHADVEQGGKDVQGALEKQRSARRKKVYLVIIGIVVVIILIIIIWIVWPF